MKTINVIGNYVDGNGNQIFAPTTLENVKVIFKGKNNKAFIHAESKLKNTTIEFCSSGGQFRIKANNQKFFGYFRIGYGCNLIVGGNCTTTNSLYITCAESTNIIIGDDCMFATGNQIRTDDAHAIYDVRTGKRTNISKSIHLGDHVWVGFNAVILGGSFIGSGSIVGYGSILKNKFPNNCIVAGVTAKLIKKDIAWERPNVLPFMNEETNSSFYLPRKYWNFTHETAVSESLLEPILKINGLTLSNENLILIEGIFILRGVECSNYTDLDYYIYFESNELVYQFPLAKGNNPKISEAYYEKQFVDYSKCHLTTWNYSGLAIDCIPAGEYNIFLQIETKKGSVKLIAVSDQVSDVCLGKTSIKNDGRIVLIRN